MFTGVSVAWIIRAGPSEAQMGCDTFRSVPMAKIQIVVFGELGFSPTPSAWPKPKKPNFSLPSYETKIIQDLADTKVPFKRHT